MDDGRTPRPEGSPFPSKTRMFLVLLPVSFLHCPGPREGRLQKGDVGLRSVRNDSQVGLRRLVPYKHSEGPTSGYTRDTEPP